ncbi:MAG TPA: DUF2934 domain-containing protein [Rudaea sp.]|nr:DUF2934 domain-containing protein [Rudaea sp.]
MKKQRSRESTAADKPSPASIAARVKPAAVRSRSIMPEHRVDNGTRRAMVAQAAYFRAEKRGFASGGEVDDWLEAEREIARMLDG